MGGDTVLAISVPTFAVLVSILINNSRLSDLKSHLDKRLDDSRDTFRADLLRLEGVLDARLSHFEERDR